MQMTNAKPVAAPGDGTPDAEDPVLKMNDQHTKRDVISVHRSKKELAGWLRISGVMIAALSLIMGGFAVGIVTAFKGTYAMDSGTLSDGNGHVVKSALAKIGLPLYVAPVMDGARLAAIDALSITVADGPDGTDTEHFLKVEEVQRVNDTAVIFSMANNKAVHVWNGEAFFVTNNGTAPSVYPVCKATATCAALYVEDKDEKEQLEEKANAALVAGGFTEVAERRRLGGNECISEQTKFHIRWLYHVQKFNLEGSYEGSYSNLLNRIETCACGCGPPPNCPFKCNKANFGSSGRSDPELVELCTSEMI